MPMGIAVTHHCNTSHRTNLRICRLVAPRQRIKPNNSMRWLTLFARLLEIIIMQVPITTMANINAIVYIADTVESSACPNKLSNSKF